VTTFLEIAVNLPHVVDVFHYHLPSELEGLVEVGHLVIVPFGSRTVQGVVLRFLEKPDISETKAVLELVDPAISLTFQQIQLASRMAHEVLAPLSACIGMMLPPGLEQQADTLYSIKSTISINLTSTQTRLVKLLNKRGPLRGQQIDRAIPRINWRLSARSLVGRGILSTQPVLPEIKVRPKVVRTTQLACTIAEAEDSLLDLGRKGSQALHRRQAILRTLMDETKPVIVSDLYDQTAGNSSDLRYLSERDLISLGEMEVLRDPLEQIEYQPSEALVLTEDQNLVWAQVRADLDGISQGSKNKPILLHGVTGSGKTEIYLHAVQHILSYGKQAIILVPEIALTPQTVRRFLSRFPGQVGLVHSKLSPGERYDTWRRARLGEIKVIVGPRSALFTPFQNLGLIVIDESHDESYFQSEAVPHFNARDMAVIYADLVGGLCLMGSATPDITTTYKSHRSGWRYLHLPTRILAHRQTVQSFMEKMENQAPEAGGVHSRFRPLDAEAEAIDLPTVNIVDMRQELKEGNRSIFSHALQSELKQILERDQQAILFLNRRGSATYVFCRDCGYTLKCPKCEIPLTFHQVQGALMCHYCAYQRRMPSVCPQCSSQRIRHFGTGTQRVEAEVKSMFPQARTLRWDFETTRKKGSHDRILNDFSMHQADILIGTQMLAKGLDLPLVTLVGVILADVGLSLPDYRTNERVFQVLTQVAGRAGRSPLGGQVILQTFQPEHYVIQAASGHDYLTFYRRELEYRRQLGYPPFTTLLRFEYRHTNSQKAEGVARDFAVKLQTWLAEEGYRATRMIGPVPCFFSRIAGLYRWQIVISGPNPLPLVRNRKFPNWKLEVNPPNLL